MEECGDGFYSPVELIARFFAPGAKKVGRFTKEEMEERQAALFGYAYAVGNGIESLVVRPGEGPQRDYDAKFRWKEGTTNRLLPVQLKRLPPAKLNDGETLENIIRKAARRSAGGDLVVAIHVDRNVHLESTVVPKLFPIRELCIWGWSKPKHAELFVNSYEIGATEGRQWQVPFPPPGIRRVR